MTVAMVGWYLAVKVMMGDKPKRNAERIQEICSNAPRTPCWKLVNQSISQGSNQTAAISAPLRALRLPKIVVENTRRRYSCFTLDGSQLIGQLCSLCGFLVWSTKASCAAGRLCKNNIGEPENHDSLENFALVGEGGRGQCSSASSYCKSMYNVSYIL